MNKYNPYAFKISYIKYLRDKIENKDFVKIMKPQSGGKQFSIRMDDWINMQMLKLQQFVLQLH